MEAQLSSSESHVGEVVRTGRRWLIPVAAATALISVFSIGVAVGASAFGTDNDEASGEDTSGTTAIGCRSEVILIVDAEDLADDSYQLRVSLGDRMVPVTHEMGYALVGTRHPQTVSPMNGRLTVLGILAHPEGLIRYELVGTETGLAEEGTLQPRPLTCIDTE
jgi:hypothetical protein